MSVYPASGQPINSPPSPGRPVPGYEQPNPPSFRRPQIAFGQPIEYGLPQQPYGQPPPSYGEPVYGQASTSQTHVVSVQNTAKPSEKYNVKFKDRIALNVILSILIPGWLCIWLLLCIIDV